MGKFTTALITDSTCDIHENLFQQYDIIVIPQVVIWGEKPRALALCGYTE